MFAIVKIAGQQFKVQEGDTLHVPHLSANNGDKVEFNEVLMTGDGSNIVVGDAVKAIVSAEVIADTVHGDKVIAFKHKRRKGFRKKLGHRTQYTQIKINGIAY